MKKFLVLYESSVPAIEAHPHFKAPGAVIDILEFLSMPGMPT
jgi:hypothetical protein